MKVRRHHRPPLPNSLLLGGEHGPALRLTVHQSLSDIIDMAKRGTRPSAGTQEALGEEVDAPKPIKAINSAADEMFDAMDELNGAKERVERARLDVHGKMRAAERTIYKYRDRTISIVSGEEKIHVKNDKPFTKSRKAEGE